MKKIKIKYFVLSILGIFALYVYILNTRYHTPNALAQTSGICNTTGTNPIVTGLASAPNLGQNLRSSSGACVVDPKAAFAPFKIPGYDDLKSIYYGQSKANKALINASANDATQTDLNNATQDTVYYITGNLNLSANPPAGASGTLVVFVDGNLNITGNYCYGAADCLPATQPAPLIGTVFVVKGNVNIEATVTRVDAIIISAGTIFTAGAGCSLPLPTTPVTNRLVINGSLISLTDTSPPKFCRKLTDNTIAAEKINHQVKYLVILRNLMSDTLQRWSEIP